MIGFGPAYRRLASIRFEARRRWFRTYCTVHPLEIGEAPRKPLPMNGTARYIPSPCMSLHAFGSLPIQPPAHTVDDRTQPTREIPLADSLS